MVGIIYHTTRLWLVIRFVAVYYMFDVLYNVEIPQLSGCYCVITHIDTILRKKKDITLLLNNKKKYNLSVLKVSLC